MRNIWQLYLVLLSNISKQFPFVLLNQKISACFGLMQTAFSVHVNILFCTFNNLWCYPISLLCDLSILSRLIMQRSADYIVMILTKNKLIVLVGWKLEASCQHAELLQVYQSLFYPTIVVLLGESFTTRNLSSLNVFSCVHFNLLLLCR